MVAIGQIQEISTRFELQIASAPRKGQVKNGMRRCLLWKSLIHRSQTQAYGVIALIGESGGFAYRRLRVRLPLAPRRNGLYMYRTRLDKIINIYIY